MIRAQRRCSGGLAGATDLVSRPLTSSARPIRVYIYRYYYLYPPGFVCSAYHTRARTRMMLRDTLGSNH